MPHLFDRTHGEGRPYSGEFAFSRQSARISICIAIVLVVAYAAASFAVPPAVYSDGGWGLLVWDSMRSGGCFNCMRTPALENIAQESYYYLSWWTPGQYLMPGALAALLPVTLGQAITVVVLIATASGLFGCYRLYRALGFSTAISSLSLVLLAARRDIALPFSIYTGGEVLLFAVLPWLVLLMLHERRSIGWIAAIAAVGVLGFIAKASLLTNLLALLGGIALFRIVPILRMSRGQTVAAIARQSVHALYDLLVIGAVVFSVAYFGHLRRGETPAAPMGFNLEPLDFLVPFVAPFSSLFSFEELFNRLFRFPGASLDQVPQEPFLVALLLLQLGFVRALWREKLGSERYRYLTCGAWLVLACIFVVLYAIDSNVTYEARHFRLLALFFLPGVLQFVLLRLKTKRALGVACAAAFLLVSIYGVVGFVQRERYLSLQPVGKRGLTHTSIDAETLSLLWSMDAAAEPARDLFYVTSPEIALEIERARRLPTHATFEENKALKKLEYYGTVPQLTLFLPRTIPEDKRNIIFASFKEYERFTLLAETARCEVFRGVAVVP